MATKKTPSRGKSAAARRNSAVDSIDLADQFAGLPPAADPALSPLSAPLQRADQRPSASPTSDPAGSPEQEADRDADKASSARTSEPAQPTQSPKASPPGSASGKGRDAKAVRAARQTRDETRDRLVREALAERGIDVDERTTKKVPKGGKHRPTIELSPEDYASIDIATTVRPDLFGTSLVGFVRACARNWSVVAMALDTEQGPDPQ